MGDEQRPGGWVEGFGWIAAPNQLPDETACIDFPGDPGEPWLIAGADGFGPEDARPVIVVAWPDGTEPVPPAADGETPVPPNEDGRNKNADVSDAGCAVAASDRAGGRGSASPRSDLWLWSTHLDRLEHPSGAVIDWTAAGSQRAFADLRNQCHLGAVAAGTAPSAVPVPPQPDERRDPAPVERAEDEAPWCDLPDAAVTAGAAVGDEAAQDEAQLRGLTAPVEQERREAAALIEALRTTLQMYGEPGPAVEARITQANTWLDAHPLAAVPDSTPETDDRRPHSRACGFKPHPHGSACHSNCPTCHGAGA